MNKITASIVKALIPATVSVLTLVCPAIPGFIWSALLNAIVNGDITLDHVVQFMKDHNIQTYHEDSDFPCKPPPNTPNNLSGP